MTCARFALILSIPTSQFLGAILVGAGSYVMVEAEKVSERLIYKCGRDKRSSNLQETWAFIRDFLMACDPNFVQNVESCPGFATQAFTKAGDGAYFDYLEVIEY